MNHHRSRGVVKRRTYIQGQKGGKRGKEGQKDTTNMTAIIKMDVMNVAICCSWENGGITSPRGGGMDTLCLQMMFNFALKLVARA